MTLVGRRRVTTRGTNVLANVVLSFVIKGAALVVSLFTLPAYLRYFGNQQVLGLWFTLLSVLSWVLNFDLGLGNGLRNRLVGSLSAGEAVKTRKYISSSYGVFAGLVAALAIGVWLGFPHVNWNSIFNVPENIVGNGALARAATIAACGILLQFELRLISSILYALQKAAMVSFISLVTSVGILAFVSTAGSGTIEHNLTILALAYVVAVNVPLIVASVVVFATSLRSCAPSPRWFDRSYAFDVLRFGGAFFLIQVLYMLITGTDPFLISWLTDPKYVVDYQIYSRPFNLVSTIAALALAPVWSAVTKAFAEGDSAWIGRLYLRLRLMALIAAFCLVVFSFFLQAFVDVWLGRHAITIDRLYALVFAVSAGMFLWNGVVSSIVNGMGRLRLQSLLLAVGVALKFPLALVLVGRGGWIWVAAVNVIALLPYCVIQPIWIGRYLREIRERPQSHSPTANPESGTSQVCDESGL